LEKWQKDLAEALAKNRPQKEIDRWTAKIAQKQAQIADEILAAGGKTPASGFGYTDATLHDAKGKKYDRPAVEELLRWRLWDRTGGGLMAELGSHQLDAAGIFVMAAHDGVKQMPLSVVAAANRPCFPLDRDADDHVFCIIEFPAPGYNAEDPVASRKKIGVQYASINGNGYGGYGEIVYGTKGTLIIEQEKETSLALNKKESKLKVGAASALDTQASGPVAAVKQVGPDVSRGYTEEEEHWAWCIRNPAPENRPRCHPKVALGDAVIALVTNMAAQNGQRITFNPEWFNPDSNETPEGVAPDVSRDQYKI
jgi:predicted dehydrogenase